ncbi:GNAT family N-acetyltransferase [Bacillus lacus]|uniref:GNAT family N-acetyltransferase n=1 Tax=Metabacillus lacus TaxID=1983721 RepID=A0A7X2J2W9_9BACI|nr:GNAT family N-acetyltransferase [Metabacillus lacus]MRX74385.1 GNAT family N-acetyltransferase [Metabacillus lacus]
MNKHIRIAVEADLPRIIEIYNSTIPSRMVTADLEPVDLESRRSWFLAHTDKRPLWVMEYDGDICGWVSFESFYGRPAYQYTAEVSIYVDSAYRGQGIGPELLTAAIDACHNLNIKTMLGYVFGHNMPSLRLFEKFGFAKWAELPNVAELDGVERDLVIVGKRVG